MALWVDIAGYKGMYQISDEGDVKSFHARDKNGRILKPGKRGRGNCKYAFVVLTDGEKIKHHSVHRLVAETFLANPERLPEVNHKDENTMNNCVENLEWCNRQYNAEYSKNKKVGQYKGDEKIAEYKSILYASEMTGICRTAISNVLNGWAHTAGGYVWKYEKRKVE